MARRSLTLPLALMTAFALALTPGCDRSAGLPPEPAEPGDHADGIGEDGETVLRPDPRRPLRHS